MQGQHNGVCVGHLQQRSDDAPKTQWVVGVFLAMDGRQDVVSGRVHVAQGRRQGLDTVRAIAIVQGGVIHDVAYVVHVVHDAFAAQIRDCTVGGAEQERRQMVRQHAVDFLGHGPIEGPQPGFDVGDRDP